MTRSMTRRTLRLVTRLAGSLLATAVAFGPATTVAAAAPTTTAEFGVPAGAARDLDGSIRLRRSVRLAPGVTAVRLRDVAWLDADTAAAIGNLIVARRDDAGGGERTLTPQAVREAIAAVGGHPARLLVQGAALTLRPGTERAEVRAPMAMTAIRLDEQGRTLSGPAARAALADARPATMHIAAAASLPGTDVMAVATHRLLTALDVSADQLRIGVIDADVAWLSRSMHDVRVRLLDDARDAEVRLEIRPRPRRAALAIAADDLIGLEADRRIAEDRVLGPDDVRRPMVVRRGDSLTVQAGRGGIRLTVKVVAREAGRIGDRITVERLNDKQTFEVIVLAPGLAEATRQSAPADAGTLARSHAGR